MAIIRYQPFGELQREINHLFEQALGGARSNENGSDVVTSQWKFNVDIKEAPKEFKIFADIPGVDPKDIEVHASNGMLVITGKRRSDVEEDKEGYHRVERCYGVFYRRFSLPESADTDNIKAKGKNGVLEITIPKVEREVSKKIDIRVE